jgi:hypothetical protein
MSIAMFATKLEEYSQKYADFIHFHREDGILEMRLHSNGGPMKWGSESPSRCYPCTPRHQCRPRK